MQCNELLSQSRGRPVAPDRNGCQVGGQAGCRTPGEVQTAHDTAPLNDLRHTTPAKNIVARWAAIWSGLTTFENKSSSRTSCDSCFSTTRPKVGSSGR